MKFAKRVWAFFKRTEKFFLSLGVVFSTILLTLALLMLVFLGFRFLKSLAEKYLQKRIVSEISSIQTKTKTSVEVLQSTPVQKIQPPVVEENLISSSFSDLFSGIGWVDTERTTMYQDRNITAYALPPKFDWKKIDPSAASGVDFVERRSDGGDVRCLRGRCLIQNDLDIFLEDGRGGLVSKIQLPESLGLGLTNLSIGALDTVWLVGGVIKEGGIFRGEVFYFDGSKFINVPLAINSKYQGEIGFGGSNGNWLAIYGAYEGMGFQIIGNKVIDISKFLGIRVMNGGFEPVVLKAGLGVESRFYVFSLTEEKPKFVKLFQNNQSEVSAALDLTNSLFVAPIRTASFHISPSDSHLIFAKIKGNLGEEFWQFHDEGFDKSKKLEIVSVNLNNYPAEVRVGRITDMDFSDSGAKTKFYLGNDGENWEEATIGKDLVFKNKNGRELRWRAVFSPDSDFGTTPFLDRIRLDFKVKLL